MVRKNWKAIAEVGNRQLRLNLISAKGEIAEGLETGFPQYFLVEDEVKIPTKEELLRLVKEAGRRDGILTIIKELGLPHQRFGFTGHHCGETKGVSYARGSYPTLDGELDYFYRSSRSSGEELEYEGSWWLVVWNGYVAGSPRDAAKHTLVIVPVEALS